MFAKEGLSVSKELAETMERRRSYFNGSGACMHEGRDIISGVWLDLQGPFLTTAQLTLNGNKCSCTMNSVTTSVRGERPQRVPLLLIYPGKMAQLA